MSNFYLMSLLLLCFMGCDPDGSGMKDETRTREMLLDRMLNAGSDMDRDTILQLHGPIVAEEVPGLADKATAWSERKWRNAAVLLTLAPRGDSRDAMFQLIRETRDVVVWAILVGPLLDGSEAKQVAALRTDMIDEALRGSGMVLRAGLRAGSLMDDPRVREELKRRVAAKDEESLAVVFEALEESGAGAGDLEPQLLALLPNTVRGRGSLLRVLVHTQSAETRSMFAKLWLKAEGAERTQLLTVFRNSHESWIYGFWLQFASSPGQHRFQAILELIKSPTPEVVKLCVDIWSSVPSPTHPSYEEAYAASVACEGIAQKLAGRLVRGQEAAVFAREWLTSHESETTGKPYAVDKPTSR